MIVIYISAKYLRVYAAADFIDRLLDLSTKRRKSESIDGLRLLGLRPLRTCPRKTSRTSRRILGMQLAEQSLEKPSAVYEIELRERMVPG